MLHKLSFALLFAVLTCGQIASARIIRPGKCPEVKLMEAFHWHYFDGVWYEHARYRNILEFREECVHSKFETISDDTVTIEFSAVKSNKEGTFDVIGEILGPGLFTFTVNKTGLNETDKIFGTDYKSWAVIYSCENIGAEHIATAWILTRLINPDEKTVGKAMGVMTQNGISTQYLRNTRQDRCPTTIKWGNTKTNLLGSLKNWLLS